MRSVLFDAGQMTARLELEAPEALSDGQGGATVSFVSVAALWARIEPVTEVREEQAGTEVFTLTHRIWLRFREVRRRRGR